MIVLLLGLVLLILGFILLVVSGKFPFNDNEVGIGIVLIIVGIIVTVLGVEIFIEASWEKELFDGAMVVKVSEEDLSYTINESGEWEIEWGNEGDWGGGWEKEGREFHNISTEDLPFTNKESIGGDGEPGCPIDYIQVKWNGNKEFVLVGC